MRDGKVEIIVEKKKTKKKKTTKKKNYSEVKLHLRLLVDKKKKKNFRQ